MGAMKRPTSHPANRATGNAGGAASGIDQERRAVVLGPMAAIGSAVLGACGGTAPPKSSDTDTGAAGSGGGGLQSGKPPVLLEVKGNHFQSAKYDGPSDWVDPSKLPAPLPWAIFADTQQTIAPSMNGVLPTAYETLHVFGNMNVLYQGTPALIEGKIVPLYPEAGTDPMANILPILRKYPLRGGGRGYATMNPYCTWHGHTRVKEDGTIASDPHVPWWVGVLMDGTMTFAFRDGSVSYPFKLPITTYCNDFTYYEPRVEKLFFAVDTGAGKVLKVDRNTNPPKITEFASGFGLATSIRAIGHKLYVADNRAGAVWELDAHTAAQRKVCDLRSVFWLDSTSTGKLLACRLNDAVHLIDPTSGTVGPSLVPGTVEIPSKTWVQVSVDRSGTFGPVDAFTSLASTGVSNIRFWRSTITGERIDAPKGGLGRMTVGNTRYVADHTGHYPWIAEHHPDDGCILVQGFANFQPTVIAVKHPSVERPTPAVPNVSLASKGETLMITGGKKLDGTDAPSFTALMSLEGWSLLGCTADYIAEMDYADSAAFVRRGMIGSTPRILTSDEMRALLYWLYYNSQRHLREGASLINDLMAADLG